METTIANTVRTYDSATLRHVRRTIEAEMLASVDACNGRMTQAHVGQLEMMQAIGSELYARGDLLEPPPFVDTCTETVAGEQPIRLTFQVRVW